MKCIGLLLFITIFGFSIGDELGFKESLSNMDGNRRRSAQVSKAQAQLIQAAQKQQEQKRAKFVDQEKVISSLAASAGQVASTASEARNIPPFKPIPPAAERATGAQPALMGIAFSPSFKTMPSSISRFAVDPSQAQVMAVVAVPKKKLSQSNAGFADRLVSVDGGVEQPVPQASSNSLQSMLSANNLTEEALELALLQRQQLINKLKNKATTTTTTSTRRPLVTSKYANSLGKVMNAPKEYYPVGYDKNFDDNFAARVDLPDTSFYCEQQKHFPGLYADVDLGCMIFHVCALTDEGLVMKSFLCPESTLFDQSILKCQWWFYVDCKNSKKLYDSNIPISKSYQLMKALTFFSSYKKETASSSTTSTTAPKSSDEE